MENYETKIETLSLKLDNASEYIITERCVLQLTPVGLKLVEVYPGIDRQKDILSLLDFEIMT